MGSIKDQALKALKDKGYSQGQINEATKKVQSQLDAGKTASQVKSDIKSNTNSYFGGNAMYGSNSSGSTSSSSSSSLGSSSSSSSSGGSGLGVKGESSNTNTVEDIYGDVSGKSTATGPMDFSTGTEITKENAVFGDNAHERQKTDSSFITKRNDSIAYSLHNAGVTDEKGVRKYLSQFDDFNNYTSQEEKLNTIRAITARLSEINKEGGVGGVGGVEGDKSALEEISKNLKDYNGDGVEDKAGFYYENGEYYKAYGYDGLSQKDKDLFDRLPDSKKKEFSNMGAEALQNALKQYDATTRAKEQLEAQHKIDEDIHDLNEQASLIQAEQTLRNAQESYNNLQQNWQYLGNMGMPGVSATKIKAIGDALTEAQTTLSEIKKLNDLKQDAQQKQWEAQVLQYTQQIDNLQYDLVWKIGQEAVDALSKYTSAELEGKLDTIDGITAFRRELLDELDSNLSGITSASLSQMQYINKQYQDVADKMYEYSKNANTVNTNMSSVLGYYVDGNGNPILNMEGQPIQVPQSAPLEPNYDKETGRLVTFSYDENGNIIAKVQQVWNNAGSSYNYGYGSGNGQYLDIPRTGNNVGADTNNFGNITSAVSGSIGMYKSPNGRSYAVFANAQDGYNALVADLTAKKSGNSRTGLNGNSTIEELMGVWVNGSGSVDPSNSYAQRFYSASGLKAGTKLSQATADQLALGIMAGEGTLDAYKKGGVDLSSYGTAGGNGGYKGYDTTLTQYYEKWFDTTKDDRARILKEYGLSDREFNTQMNNYFAEKEQTEAVQSITALRDKAQELLDWNKKNSSDAWYADDLHQGWKDLETYKNGSYKGMGGLQQGQTKASEGVRLYNWIKNNQTLDKFINAKKQGASFGAMSEGEWKILGDSASDLTWETNNADFEGTLQRMIDTYNEKLEKITGKPVPKAETPTEEAVVEDEEIIPEGNL